MMDVAGWQERASEIVDGWEVRATAGLTPMVIALRAMGRLCRESRRRLGVRLTHFSELC
jgi:hypothetical protein